MITLILDNEITNKRKVFENMTIREFGEKIVELSKDWVLVFDTVSNLNPMISFDIYLVAVSRRG